VRHHPEPSSKIQLRVPTTLKAEIDRQAEELGQPLTVYVTRALVERVMRGKTEAPEPSARA
jgi:predicted HicB family RNase H-like nuclease